MVYSYTPTYYSSFQDTLTTICKSILLPFSSHKSRRLAGAADHKRHTDNLKWQQESFHRILHLIGLHREGIVPESDVSAFRSHLLDTLIASPAHQEPPAILRDKLIFLQELFHAKCISADEYHSSKRPLLQRLAAQGVEIDSRDVIVGDPAAAPAEEWSVIDLRDTDSSSSTPQQPKQRTPTKSLVPKSWMGKGKNANADDENRKSNEPLILMPESTPAAAVAKSEKVKRRPFRALFHKEQQDENGGVEERGPKSAKKQWGFDGFKKWKKGSSEDGSDEPYLLSEERSEDMNCTLVASPIGEGPDTARMKKKLHSDGAPSDFFIDKVLGDNIKKELSRIQSELSQRNPNLNFSDEQIETISTRLPVDKSDLKNFFPKTWCDNYGDIVLNVVKKEFKDHVCEMETMRNAAKEKQCESKGWVSFDENDENRRPDTFSSNSSKNMSTSFANNPFHDDGHNPFWTPRG